MPLATHASLTLARFDSLLEPQSIETHDMPGTLFLGGAGDIRAGALHPGSINAFKFAILGLHDSEESARSAVKSRGSIAPWINDAIEVWSGVLEPFRHFGEANFIDHDEPGPQFLVTASEPPAGAPILIMTSAGFDVSEGTNMDPIRDFGSGVAAVRISMTGVPGLHSQQTFSFPGLFDIDGITVTFWRDFAAARDFAYGAGLHRQLMKRQRDDEFGARTSFTRFAVIHSEGTWHGSDPLVW